MGTHPPRAQTRRRRGRDERDPVPLHRRAGRADRGRLAGPVGGARHLPRTQPRRAVGRPRGRRRAHRRAPPRPRHVPLPERRRPARRPPAGLHRDRRLRPLPPDARQERPALPGVRRLRAARRAVRRADRPAPAQDDRGQHRHHGAPAAPPRAGPRRPTSHRDDRPRLLPLDPVDLPPDPRVLVRRGCRAPGRWAGSRTPHHRARRGVPLRRAPPAQRGRPRLGRPVRRRAGRHPRRPAARLHERGPRQLVPRAGHGALQRGGHQRRPVRAGQLPGLQAQPAPVDDADHGILRPARRRPRPGRLAREGPDHAAQLDRPQPRGPRHLPGRVGGPGHRGVHDPTRHAVRRDVHGARAGAPARRRAGPRRRLARGHEARVDRRCGHPDRGGRGLPSGGLAQERHRAPDRGQGQDGGLHRRVGDQPRHRDPDPGVRRRLRAHGLRDRRDHGRARPGRA